MRRYFTADAFYKTIYDIPPDFFSEHGITAILSDIDNTLIPYEEEVPSEPIRAWLSALAARGIRVAVASNNHRPRVEKFNETLGLFAVSNAAKPSRRAVKQVLRHFGVKPEQLCLIGDQIFTDVMAAKRAGCICILVEPIRDKRDLFTRLKRYLERPFKGEFLSGGDA